MNTGRILIATLVSLTLAFCGAALLHAQSGQGGLAGRVTDQYGAPLPGAFIRVIFGSTSRSAVTDARGDYTIARLTAGNYTVWFVLSGFNTVARPEVSVPIGPSARLDATLQITPLCEDCPDGFTSQNGIRVTFETTAGSFVVAVEPNQAPITAANFLKYVDGGFYTGGQFHRATRSNNYTISLPNRPLLECIQAGINPEKKSESLPAIPLETTDITSLKHVVGTVSMARGADADTATSDFFILLNDQPSLDYGGKRFDDGQGAAAFGRVVSGMDVVRKIQQQPTDGQALKPPITILSATRVQ